MGVNSSKFVHPEDKIKHIVFGYIHQHIENVYHLQIADDIKQLILFINREMLIWIFTYEHDYDKNGIIWHLGTLYGIRNKWINPALDNKIKLNASSWQHGKLSNILARRKVNCWTEQGNESWITVDFGDKYRIKPNAYTIRHSRMDKCWGLTDWSISGSIDGINYTRIRYDNNAGCDYNKSKFRHGYQSLTFPLECSTFYSKFKIERYEYNVRTNMKWKLCISGFELYGQMIVQ